MGSFDMCLLVTKTIMAYYLRCIDNLATFISSKLCVM